MPRTRTLMRLFVFIGLAMFIADSISAQVVIRERVEVDAAQSAAQSPAAHLGGDGPVVGYYVYKPRVTSGFYSVGGPLAGTINITTTEGILYSADVSQVFTHFDDFPPYNCVDDPDSPYANMRYAAIVGAELLPCP